MLGTLDRKFTLSIVVNHLWNAGEGLAELSQYVTHCSRLGSFCCNFHMHEATTAPGINNRMINSYYY